MGQSDWDRVAQALEDLDFPADKDAIVAHARSRGAGDETVRLLRALPLAVYRNISEIRSSVPLDPAEEEGRTEDQRAEQARSGHTGVAEYLRDR